MIKETMLVLKEKYCEISKKGWIESVCLGPAGIGLTFERELGLKCNGFEIPDFEGIEIKTKRRNSMTYTTLFNATFDGKYLYELKRIYQNYGWPDSVLKQCNVFHTSLYANQSISVGNRWYMKLKIDYSVRKVFLVVYDKLGHIIEEECSWSFELLKEKLFRKLNYLMFVEAETKIIHNKEYFHYNKIKFYELNSFNDFLYLMEIGYIRVSFKVGVFRSGKRMGKPYDHGTGFEIKNSNIHRLYKKISI